MIMKLACGRNSFTNIPELPAGFSYRNYQEGDEKYWAETETAVLEFSSTEKASLYFQKDFMPYESELKTRMVFITNEDGIPVANATAWWHDEQNSHQPCLHWVAVRPEYQGLGLGRAVVVKALSLFSLYEPHQDIYLHTQTWSHVAVRLYMNLGFQLCRKDTLGSEPNDYESALEVLKDVLDEDTFRRLVETSVS
ncbi:MAG: GNAT family N-acetyltransferase [Eubacteriales bacterium]